MKNIRLLYFLAIFKLIFSSYTAVAAEEVKVYPINVKCGQIARFGIRNLIPEQKYKLRVDCADLKCSQGFESTEEEVAGKSTAIIDKQFDIDNACRMLEDEGSASSSSKNINTSILAGSKVPVPAPAGKYIVVLLNQQNQVLASAHFYLVSPLAKGCEIKTNVVGDTSISHKFKLETNLACVYNIFLVNPEGKRIALTTQFVSGNRPLLFTIKKELTQTPGNYRLTALADKQCLKQQDRECKEAKFTLNNSASASSPKTKNTDVLTCVYAQNDIEGNCLQCGSGDICANSGICVNDNKAECTTNATLPGAVDNQEPKNARGISSNTFYSGLFMLFTLLITAGVLIFRPIRYRIKEDETRNS